MEHITFGDIREYCSRMDRISICLSETLEYQNYERMDLVPHDYNGLYLYGFGMITSEFPAPGGQIYAPCIEFMLSENPRGDPT